MLPGPFYVYTCPNCGNLLSKGSLMSGNTFGARIFSDGKRIAPMLPEYPNLTKCKKCDRIFWLSKLKEIGTFCWDDFPCWLDGSGGNPKTLTWRNADSATFLNIDDYQKAIEMGLIENVAEEIMIRQNIWWAYNDRIRDGQNIFTNDEDEERWKDNINLLMNLLDQSDINQRIMVADIYRNLGDFESCIHLIRSIDSIEHYWLKEQFENECKNKNRWVVEIIH
jgi:hypothetical protein